MKARAFYQHYVRYHVVWFDDDGLFVGRCMCGKFVSAASRGRLLLNFLAHITGSASADQYHMVIEDREADLLFVHIHNGLNGVKE